MKEQRISLDTAKLAREKGFNIHCIEGYTIEGGETLDIGTEAFTCKYYAPTQSLLQKWLREEHKIDVEARPVRYAGDKETSYYQSYINGCVISMKKYNTYEEALEVSLFEALKLIPTKD